MTSTSVTDPNWPKYSLSFSGVVCQERPPTKSLPGELSEEGVLRPEPEEPFCGRETEKDAVNTLSKRCSQVIFT